MSLKQQAVIGSYWMGGSATVGIAMQVGSIVVLARLLTPQDFGLVAMVTVVVGLVQVYADMGISNAIIHRQDTTIGQLSSLYWLNIVAGITAYLVLVSATPLIVSLYTEPRLNELVPVAALTLLIAPLGMQFRVLLQKDMHFKALAIVESIAAAAGAVTAIGLAMAGKGLYAIIFGVLASTTATTVLAIAIGWRKWPVRLTFRLTHLNGYISFGLYQMGERTINYVWQKLDQLLIGALIGGQALGYYNLAANLVYLPLQRINPILTRVAFPLFAKVQNNTDQLKRGFMIMRRTLALLNFPLYLGLAASAPVLVPVIFGEQWAESIVLIQILALVAAIRATGNPIGSLLLAKGRTDYGFYWNLVVSLVQVPVIVTGAHFGGAVGVATAILVAQLIYFAVGYLVLVRRLIGPCLGQYLGALGPAAFSASIMATAVLIYGGSAPSPAYSLLTVQVIGGLAIYLALHWFLFRNHTMEIARLVLGQDSP